MTQQVEQAPAGEGSVEFSSVDGLGVIRLNRPEARNAIDMRFVDDLHEAVHRCAADGSVRALLIRGEGPSFTVGGGVMMLARTGPGDLPAMLRRLPSTVRRATSVGWAVNTGVTSICFSASRAC